MNGVYWGLAALEIMGHGDVLAKDDLVEFVLSCWDRKSGELLLELCARGRGPRRRRGAQVKGRTTVILVAGSQRICLLKSIHIATMPEFLKLTTTPALLPLPQAASLHIRHTTRTS